MTNLVPKSRLRSENASITDCQRSATLFGFFEYTESVMTPQAQVHWLYVWKSRRKFNGPSPADPFIRKCLIHEILNSCYKMEWGSILLKLQAIEIWSLFRSRHDDSFQFVTVIFSSDSSVQELWTYSSSRRFCSSDSYSRLVQFRRDRKMKISVTPLNTVVAI